MKHTWLLIDIVRVHAFLAATNQNTYLRRRMFRLQFLGLTLLLRSSMRVCVVDFSFLAFAQVLL